MITSGPSVIDIQDWKNNTIYDCYEPSDQVIQWFWEIVESYDQKGFKDSGTFLFVAGDLGIEYNFEEVPIQLSLDIRPELYFNSDDFREDSFGPDIALGIRYRF